MRLNYLFVTLLFACCAHANNPSGTTDSVAVAHFNQTYSMTAPLTEGYAKVGDVNYHYVSAGEGPLVILYHGFPSFWYAWKFQIAELAKHYRVVAVDGLGSNLSDKPSAIGRYRIDKLAEDLNQLAYQLSDDKTFHLIGHDWGGALSWAFAQRYPQRVEKLIVLNAPPYNLFLELLRNNAQQQKVSRYIDILSHPMGEAVLGFNDSYLIWSMAYQKHLDHNTISKTEADLFRQALARPQALHSAINWYRANTPTRDNINSWPKDNPTVKAPSLLIWGVKDKTFVAEFLELLPNYVDQLTIERLPNAAHWPSLSHAERVNRTIIDFLKAPQG